MSYLTCIILTAISLTLCSCKTPPAPEPLTSAQTQVSASTTPPPTFGENAFSSLGSPQYQGTALGQYDARVIDQIKQRWLNYLDSVTGDYHQTGKVVVVFTFYSNGQVSGLKITENTTNTYLGNLCTAAIGQSSPFPPWPEEAVKIIGKNYRNVLFTFCFQ